MQGFGRVLHSAAYASAVAADKTVNMQTYYSLLLQVRKRSF